MKSLISTVLIFGVFLFIVNGCINNNNSIGIFAFSTTVTVVDRDNKPLAGQKVKLVYGVGAGAFAFNSPNKSYHKWDSTITDNLGKATFNYELSTSESHADNATFGTEEEKIWKNVETISHTINENLNSKSVNLLSITLRKDSLVPLSVRVQKTNNRVGGISFGVYSDPSITFSNGLESAINNHRFFSWSSESVTLVDTTFDIKVYSKAACTIPSDTLLVQGNNKFWLPYKSVKFNPQDFKTKQLVLQF